jgi:hypothetical protein
MWNGSRQSVAWGHCSATARVIHSPMSLETSSSACLRSGPSWAKKRVTVSLSRPSRAQTSSPVSWSTTTVMYRCPTRQESSSIPARLSVSSGSPWRARSSTTTRSMILPTVYHETRISSHTAAFEQRVASHATCCSNSRVNQEPCRAHGTRATTTPWRRHDTRGASASTNAFVAPRSSARHRRLPSPRS